ncbi:NusG domain II-containing protein [Peptoniphilus sp. MSJ-1]|uniref:NusG domain II-containing protein n=1 Tax=Peptoniphilus ovalis TaxID=2841503 RepID=A0ABS6FJ15_9FIRM|nr:NusG domain II-containing protein [Peptoniphilus ovalis]MBU5669195.1 NusG domain II-containing protein [Peptoniphilus ovalis]
MKLMKKLDYVVILVLIIFSVVLYFITNNSFSGIGEDVNKKAVITIDGKIYKEIELAKGHNEEIEIKSQYGENVITIEDGRVHMHESDCKDRICIRMGEISTPGDSIICLPNRLMVKIVSEDKNNDELDMILK